MVCSVIAGMMTVLGSAGMRTSCTGAAGRQSDPVLAEERR
jgi:hypothetical protein